MHRLDSVQEKTCVVSTYNIYDPAMIMAWTLSVTPVGTDVLYIRT